LHKIANGLVVASIEFIYFSSLILMTVLTFHRGCWCCKHEIAVLVLCCVKMSYEQEEGMTTTVTYHFCLSNQFLCSYFGLGWVCKSFAFGGMG